MLFDAMFLNPGGINANLILLAICITGLIVGFAWIRWAAGPDPDKEPSFWRYRQADKVRWLSNVKWPMPGWIATRLAMAVAAGVLVFVFAPRLLRVFVYAVGNAPWLWLVVIALASAGTLWILRIARADPDADVDLDEFMAESNARAKRGRALGRMMIYGVLVVLAFAAFLWIAAPNGPSAMYLQEPEPRALELALPFVGVAGLVIGLAWMVRILRAHHEPETKGWRYRDF
jgi:hypothetical protein